GRWAGLGCPAAGQDAVRQAGRHQLEAAGRDRPRGGQARETVPVPGLRGEAGGRQEVARGYAGSGILRNSTGPPSIRVRMRSICLVVLVALLLLPTAARAGDAIIIESYVGPRPKDATQALEKVFDELS